MFSRLSFVALLCVVVCDEVLGQCEGSVNYRVSNLCVWTKAMHPTDYPDNAQLGSLCGTVHNGDYTIFKEGEVSTAGVQVVAEEGGCEVLEGEIRQCVMDGGCAAEGYFAWTCDTSRNEEGVSDAECTHSGIIKVQPEYPYVSLISGMKPTPDWFVGKSSVQLCHRDENTGAYYWLDRYPREGSASLYAHDAGTDSGETFLSADAMTDPFEPISIFDAVDDSNLFFNSEAGALYPICVLIFEKE